jgi:chitin disaccharide deacetylase
MSRPCRRHRRLVRPTLLLCAFSALWATSVVLPAAAQTAPAQSATPTYAELLGWKTGDRVAMFHIDDVGMSHESNVGAIRSITEGVATSLSVMMPCSWVPEFVAWLKEHPDTDAGLHLTLTSEWEHYRWGPLVGDAGPGLRDPHGYLWRNVPGVVANASADEVETEIRAQIAKARAMGFEPTHLDSHMGTLFASPQFLERYIKVGIETGIPIMVPGGHNSALRQQYLDEARERLERRGEWRGQELPEPPELARAPEIGKLVWSGGLPVLDDLHNTSYGWRPAEGEEISNEALTRLKVERYTQAVRELKPGVTMIILHAADAGPAFDRISTSGATRRGDMLAMIAPELRKVIEEEGIILTTWRELKQRRDAVDGGIGRHEGQHRH